MTPQHKLRIALATITCAALAAPSLAGAKPRNELQFTRPVVTQPSRSVGGTSRQSGTADAPFTVPQDVRDHQQDQRLVALFGNPWAATHLDISDTAASAKAVPPEETLPTTLGTQRVVDDWFRDPTPIATPAGDRIVDDSFRDPTPIATPAGDRIVDDSFRDASPVVASQASGGSLNWEDFGLGAGAMLGLTLLLTGLGLGALVTRHRTGKVETS